jgi:uncharacterized membrane protein
MTATQERTPHDTKSTGEQPLDRLKSEVRNLGGALGERAVAAVGHKVEGSVARLKDYVADGGGPGLAAAVTGASKLAEGKSGGRALFGAGLSATKKAVGGLLGGGGGSGKGKNLKVTNIVESIDVGVPVRTAYDQWTQFTDFPSFMKKVENVEQESDEKLKWKAQILWSHRSWESTIVEQRPDEAIIWTSKGQKGHVDGAVTFHEIGPRETRVLLVLEYHPQGFFEHTGNLWRAQGRRARLELKHYRRHMMTKAVLHPEDIEGWRGVISDGEVVKDHQTAIQEEEEKKRQQDQEMAEEPEDSADAEDQDYEDEEGEENEEDEEYEENEDEEEEDGQEHVREGRDQ